MVINIQFSSVQSLSRVRLFATPWIAACQASLSITNSRSSLNLTSIESMMPSSHLILCHSLHPSWKWKKWSRSVMSDSSQPHGLQPTRLLHPRDFPGKCTKEGWAPKNWCLQIVVLEKILESSLDCRRSNQSILKEINPEYSLEGQMLNLQYFGHLMQRADSRKDPDMGNYWGREEKGMTGD